MPTFPAGSSQPDSNPTQPPVRGLAALPPASSLQPSASFPGADGRNDDRGRRWRPPLRTALLLWLVCSSVYALFAWERLLGPSTDPHFILQAEAFLQGSLELTRSPPHGNDWASYHELVLEDGRVLRGVYRSSGRGGQSRRFRTFDGRTLIMDRSMVRKSRKHSFVSFPCFPAVLMMPFVALLGRHFSDVVFTVVLAGLNIGLVFLLLELLVHRCHSSRTRRENLLLSLLFAFGTAHFWCSVLGQVWFTALVLGVTLSTLYLMAALDGRHPWLAGLCLGMGMATRTPLAFMSVFFLLQLLFAEGRHCRGSWVEKGKLLLRFSTPVLLIGAALMAMNFARFGDPFEFGHSYLAGGSIERIKYYGLFGLRFVPRNLAAAFILLPALSRSWPYLRISRHGMSLLLSTPPLVYLLRPGRQHSSLLRMLWVTALVVALPLLFYQNTGHIQFGYRFSLDLTSLMIAALALGSRPLGKLFWVLALLGVAVNTFGAVSFKRFDLFYDDHFPELSV